jgi:hypothetical protein
MPATLTNANSSMAMTTEALYPSAQRIQGYATDDAYEGAAVENGEYLMGIDGKLSAGFVFNAAGLTMTLQADSPSLLLFENIYQYEQTNRTKLLQQVTISIPGLGRRYSYKDGYMTSYKVPAGKKIMQPAVVEFTFARAVMTPL